jgi:hypothetical protein
MMILIIIIYITCQYNFLISLPISKRYQREMGFPKEGEVFGGFRVESVSIEHVAAYTDKLARYKYPTKIIVKGDGTVDDVKKAVIKFFVGEKTLHSSYENPYRCESGEMHVHDLGENKFKIEALGSCVRVLEEELKTEKTLDLKEVALKAFEAVFTSHKSVRIDGEDYFVESTSSAGLRFVKIGKYTFLEQNPNKSSRWAKLAREGHNILWVLMGRRYLAQVRDGVFYDFRKS